MTREEFEHELIDIDSPKIVRTRFYQILTLSQEIIDNPKFTGRLEDEYIECLMDCWQAIKKFYGVK